MLATASCSRYGTTGAEVDLRHTPLPLDAAMTGAVPCGPVSDGVSLSLEPNVPLKKAADCDADFSKNRILIVDSDEYSIATRPWLPKVPEAPLEKEMNKWTVFNTTIFSDNEQREPMLISYESEGREKEARVAPDVLITPAANKVPLVSLGLGANARAQGNALTLSIAKQMIQATAKAEQQKMRGMGPDKRVRINFTERQRSILNGYLQTHQSNPYASSNEIDHLCDMTGLSPRQIRTYFTNRRMRNSKGLSLPRFKTPTGRPPKDK